MDVPRADGREITTRKGYVKYARKARKFTARDVQRIVKKSGNIDNWVDFGVYLAINMAVVDKISLFALTHMDDRPIDILLDILRGLFPALKKIIDVIKIVMDPKEIIDNIL